MLNVILALTVLFLLINIAKRNGNYWRSRKVVFEKPLFPIGNIVDVLLSRKSFAKVVSELYLKFKEPFFGIWILNDPQLVIRCPNLIRNVIATDFDHFQDRNVTCSEEIDNFSANMLFLMKYPKCKTMRAEMTPIYSLSKLKSIHPRIQNISKTMVCYIKTITLDGQLVDVKELCKKYVLETTGCIVFGVELDSFKSTHPTPNINIFASFIEGIAFILYLCRSVFVEIFRIKLFTSSMRAVFRKFSVDILERRKLLPGVFRTNLVDYLISNNKELSDGKLHECISFIKLKNYCFIE